MMATRHREVKSIVCVPSKMTMSKVMYVDMHEHSRAHQCRAQSLSPVVAPIDGINHVRVNETWVLVTLPLPLLLAGAGKKERQTKRKKS